MPIPLQAAAGAPGFQLFGTAHLMIIALTIGLPVLVWQTARGVGREGYRRTIRYGLSALLLINYAAYEVTRAMDGQFNLKDAAPMQLCDWAMVAVVVALITRRMGWYEVAYFWGMAGTLQAILTPNLQVGFPNLRFISFFVAHCGIVMGVLYLTAVEGLRPRAVSIVRAMLWSEVYFGAALLANEASGANYGFLSHRPLGKSLLDYLSDNHAIYLLELNLLAVAFYTALYLPFLAWDLIGPKPAVSAVTDRAAAGPVSRWLL